MPRPSNIIVANLLVTDLSQQLKKQRDFLKWMARRYQGINPDQAAAFSTGARLFDELRSELLAGLFNAGQVKELFTEEELQLQVTPESELLQQFQVTRAAGLLEIEGRIE